METGLESAAATVLYAGVIPTPAVAFLVRSSEADAGIAVSASHNPYPDNGVKLFDRHGFKWGRREEEALEAQVAALGALPVASTPLVQATDADPMLGERYLAFLLATLPRPHILDGIEISIDAANGAASPFARTLFASAGAKVHVFHADPDGQNINVGCGSTQIHEIARRTVETGSDLGAAFDGDADRCLIADEAGRALDGDAILYLWARHLMDEGSFEPRRVVVTTMSNLGLEVSLARLGVEVLRCDVGDRAVVETMRRRGVLLGGEQSGHLVHLGLSTTGDGLLSALQVAVAMARAGRSLSELLAGFETYPQVLHNVRVRRQEPFDSVEGLSRQITQIRRRLGKEGRLVLRYSGTEPVVRIMLEGPDQATIEEMAGELAETLRRRLGP